MKAKKNYKSIITAIVLIAIAIALGYGAWRWYKTVIGPGQPDDIAPGRITDIRPMVELCTLEFFREVPMRDSIGTKHIFARRKIEGQIRFDIDSLPVDVSADTIKVTLPREKVIIRESTDDNAYEIIDVWNASIFGSSRLSNAEENIFRRRHDARVRQELYDDGTVERARRDASDNLATMLSIMYRRPAIVIIPK